MGRYINGKLEDYDFQQLMDNVKKRGESLFTTLEYNGNLYDFSIHAMEFFTKIDENTLWYFDVVKEDTNGDQKRLTNYKEHSNLLEPELVKKMDELRNLILENRI